MMQFLEFTFQSIQHFVGIYFLLWLLSDMVVGVFKHTFGWLNNKSKDIQEEEGETKQ